MKRHVVPKALLALSLASFAPSVKSLQPPTQAAVATYRTQGRLTELSQRAKQIGNHETAPQLVQRLQRKLRVMQLRQQGVPESEIQGQMAPLGPVDMPSVGTVRVLALLIAFQDQPALAADTPDVVRTMLFGDGSGGAPYESLRNFYRRSSYNKLEIQGNVLGWWTAPYNRSSVAETAQGRDKLIREALTHYDNQGHDFSQYDSNGDGKIDYLVVIWAGPHGDWATFWWGYQTSYSDSTLVLDGKRLGRYSWQWESASYPSGAFSPNVVIHETGHALGLPDLYDYDDTVGPKGGAGCIDQMASNWGDHNGFSKVLLEWIDPVIFNSGTNPVVAPPTGDHAYTVMAMPKNAAAPDPTAPFGEFFVVQNRHRVGNDVGLPADGVLVWHVDSTLNASGTGFQFNNSYTTHKLVRLMEADGLEQIEAGSCANAGDYFTQGDVFGPQTTPSSALYSGARSSVEVRDIGPSGPQQSFTVTYGIDLGRIANIRRLCAIVGCRIRWPWLDRPDPADIFARAVARRDARSEKLTVVQARANQLARRVGSATPADLATLDAAAGGLLEEMKALGVDPDRAGVRLQPARVER